MVKTNINSYNVEFSNTSMWRETFEGLSPATKYNVTITATYEDEYRTLISAPSSIELFTSSSEFIPSHLMKSAVSLFSHFLENKVKN